MHFNVDKKPCDVNLHNFEFLETFSHTFCPLRSVKWPKHLAIDSLPLETAVVCRFCSSRHSTINSMQPQSGRLESHFRKLPSFHLLYLIFDWVLNSIDDSLVRVHFWFHFLCVSRIVFGVRTKDRKISATNWYRMFDISSLSFLSIQWMKREKLCGFSSLWHNILLERNHFRRIDCAHSISNIN